MDGVCGAAEVSRLGDSYDGGSVTESDSFGEKAVLLCSQIRVCTACHNAGEHQDMHLLWRVGTLELLTALQRQGVL